MNKNPEENPEIHKVLLESVENKEQVQEIIEGKLKDAWFIKLRIDVENKSGILIAAISKYKKKVLEVYSVFTDSAVNNRVRTYEDFSQMTNHMIEASQDSPLEKAISETIGRVVYRAITPEIIEKQAEEWAKGDPTSLIFALENAIHEEMQTKNNQIQADVEDISSYVFRLQNPLTETIAPVTSPFVELEKESPEMPVATTTSKKQAITAKTPAEQKIQELSESYDRVISAKTVLAPVKGIEFDKLQPGQKLLFTLPFHTQHERSLARKLGAVGIDGLNHPIAAEFIEIVEGGKSEFHIFARGPQNTLIRAFEERQVRLAIAKDDKNTDSKSFFAGKSFMIHLIITVILVLVTIAVIYFNQG